MKINGRELANTILENLKHRVEKLQKEHSITPTLAVIRVGNDPAITSYINQKQKAAEMICAKVRIFQYDEHVSENELLDKLHIVDSDEHVHGVIMQLPVPNEINEEILLAAINPTKDVDGFHPVTRFYVPLAMAVIEILKDIHFHKDPLEEIPFIVWLQTRSIVVIGRGKTGGQPVIDLLQKMKLNPSVIDSTTINPDTITKHADIIITAVGKKHVITQQNIKQGVILIGVGMHKDINGKFYGDYDEEEVKDYASFYTPIPGGVGPINVAKLMENVVIAAERTAALRRDAGRQGG